MRHAPRGYNRTDRIADQIQKDLAVLIQREIKDPRLGMTTVTSVKVSKDLSYADIYVTFMGVEISEQAQEELRVLEHASGFLRTALAKNISLRIMPKLRFHYDETILEGPRIGALINEAIEKDQQHSPDVDDKED